MPSDILDKNEQMREVDIFDILPPLEGSINIYYGRIGGGKTSAGTRNILRELEAGLIVYSNWKINWEGYDETKDKWKLFLGSIGLKRTFFYFPPTNYHFWDFVNEKIDGKTYRQFFPKEKFYDDNGHETEKITFTHVLSKLTDCSIHLDEGHIPFDSYEATRMSEAKRSAVFAMRHFDRSLTVYTQRANSVHVNLRGNTNRFYKCEKTFDHEFFGKRFIHFQITEFQDLTSSSTVDESRILDEEGLETDEYKYAVSQERYWGRKNLFKAFNSKYLRDGLGHSQPNYATFADLKWHLRIHRLFTRRALLPPVKDLISN